MKNVGFVRKNLILLSLCVTIGIFSSSCGLETVYSLNAPEVTYNNPLYSSSDPLTWYFNFVTAENSDLDKNLSYTGTDVYYKIYNNYSNLNSQKSSILSVNTDSNGNSAATRMIETYSYQQLGASSTTGNAVFFKGHDGRRVVIRLKDYQNGIGEEPSSDSADYETKSAEYAKLLETRYSQGACVGYYSEKNSTGYEYESYIPYRNAAVGTKSFDFFDYDEDDKGGTRDVEPAEGDADYYYASTFSEENCYFVQLFAVARAWNTSEVSPAYSLVLDLGSVPIRKGE